MKTWICYGIAGVLAGLGLLVLPESVREAHRMIRLNHDGLRIAAEIIGIKEQSVGTTEDSVDQARYGPYMIVEEATLRYFVGGKEYESRHRLPEPIHSQRPGDKVAIVVLPDDPGRSYPTYQVTGAWMMSFMVPVIPLVGAAAFAGGGFLLRQTSQPVRLQRRQK